MRFGGMVSDHGDEQVSNAWGMRFAQSGKLLAINTIKQHHATSEHLAFVDRLESAGCGNLPGIDCQFHIARFQFVHAAGEHDAAAIHKHKVGEDVVGNSSTWCVVTTMVRLRSKVVIQQRVIELLAKQKIEAKRGLVQHQ